MKDEHCIFCKIVKGEYPSYKLYETESIIAFLDITPISPGHTLIVPKIHYETLDKIPLKTIKELGKTILIISKSIVKTIKSEGYFILQSNHKVAGQEIPHVHFHIIPVWKNLNTWEMKFTSLKIKKKEMKNIANKLKSKL